MKPSGTVGARRQSKLALGIVGDRVTPGGAKSIYRCRKLPCGTPAPAPSSSHASGALDGGAADASCELPTHLGARSPSRTRLLVELPMREAGPWEVWSSGSRRRLTHLRAVIRSAHVFVHTDPGRESRPAGSTDFHHQCQTMTDAINDVALEAAAEKGPAVSAIDEQGLAE